MGHRDEYTAKQQAIIDRAKEKVEIERQLREIERKQTEQEALYYYGKR